MNLKDYVVETLKTAPTTLGSLELDLSHMGLGITTEAGEIADSIKRYIAYGVKLDVSNLEEEIGDVLWYLSVLSHLVGLDMETILDKNIEKLRLRHGDSFSASGAVERDVVAEMMLFASELNDNELKKYVEGEGHAE